MRLLKGCKSWGGPCLSINVLSMILNKYSDKEKITVITEMAHFAHSHKIGKLAQPELFCLNRINVNEQLENLTIFLGKDEDNASTSVANVPTNEDVATKVSGTEVNKQISVYINKICAIVWVDRSGQYN